MYIHSPFEDGAPSLVKNNIITNCDSINGMYVIGIDIQGDTQGLDIIDNIVNLNNTIANDVSDRYFALIIGENADEGGLISTILIDNNVFSHEQLIQNTQTSRREEEEEEYNYHHHERRRVAEWQIRPSGRYISEENDIYNLGGCPFAGRS